MAEPSERALVTLQAAIGPGSIVVEAIGEVATEVQQRKGLVVVCAEQDAR